MKNLTISLLFCISLGAQAQELGQLRTEFIAATGSAPAAEKFLQTTSRISASSKPLLVAYRGAALVIWGKYVRGIEDKKKTAKAGIALLESAISKNPGHVEIRTLRLSIQENSPKILKYKDNIEEDRNFVTRSYEELPEGELKSFIGGYLSNP
ncbi:MAG TPA: hypothetical protein VFM90_08565, partial [Cyclobacteriaceae bacterium]|nr:hypothetical protein [Cyclobacteriaceae bacterium]